MSILVLNAGSSSLKLSLFDSEARALLAESTCKLDFADSSQAIRQFVEGKDIDLIGHRIVHGGIQFQAPIVIDEKVGAVIAELSKLAPLHNPPALRALEGAKRLFPHAKHVAVFDTTFFSPLPESAFFYPVPYKWYEQWGIRRFGFHGLSHSYCAERARAILGRSAQRLVICHLGSGCSASAVLDGKPVSTTMGFTPMEGLMMATRSGSIDPGILIYLLKERGLTAGELEQVLNFQSGLLGVSGISADYREVEKAAAENNPRAKLALEMYADALLSAIVSLAARLEGMDALLFTGGVGENRVKLRASVCERLSWLGVKLDGARNSDCSADTDITERGSAVRVLVIRTREDLMIAQAARSIG